MNEQILQELQRTNDILVGIAIMLLFGLVLWAVKSIVAIFRYGSEIKKDAWNGEANSLYSRGKNVELLELAQKKLKKEPRNPTGIYWKAMAEKELGKENDLRVSIPLLLQLVPKWKEDWMDEYVEER